MWSAALPTLHTFHPWRALAAHHLLVALAALDHDRRWGAPRLHLAAQLIGRGLVERGLVTIAGQHDAVILSRRRPRDLALDHVAQHELRFAREWIAPAAAAGGHHANHLAREHRLAV